jgi:hypothetical protein
MTNELVAAAGAAKSAIDAGFSRVGRKLAKDDVTAGALMVLAARAVANANALAILAEHKHANESLPILRSLLETAVQMRWIVRADSAKRASEVLEERGKADWEDVWQETRVKSRAKELGFWDATFERVLSSCREHLNANAAGLPWGHVFAGKDDGGVSADEVLRATTAVMAHVVKALDERWPGEFPGAEEMWKKAERGLRS